VSIRSPRAVVASSGVPPVTLARLRRRHLRAVLAIEERIFPSPWSPAVFLSELALGDTRAYYVARAGRAVVGYAGLMAVLGEGHVTTIGVAPEHQHRGIGRLLLYALFAAARRRGCTDMTLEVRVANHDAQRLYYEFGFVPAGIRPNYYREIGEDALVMWAHEVDSPAYTERLELIARRIAERGTLPRPPEPGDVP
jgi:ribosomal-protein-alanine N-acetyltransferase